MCCATVQQSPLYSTVCPAPRPAVRFFSRTRRTSTVAPGAWLRMRPVTNVAWPTTSRYSSSVGSVASAEPACWRSVRAEVAGPVHRPRLARPHVDRSAFAGFRFPPEVITVAVRWYLRCGLSYRDIEELLAEARCRRRPCDCVPVGAAVHSVVRRRRPAAAARCRGPLVRRRDLRQGHRPMAVPVPGDRPIRSDHRRAALRAPGHRRRPPVLHPRPPVRACPGRGHHRQGRPVPAGARGPAASGSAHHRAIRQQPGRKRSCPVEGAAAAGARAETVPVRRADRCRSCVRAEPPPRPLRPGHRSTTAAAPGHRIHRTRAGPGDRRFLHTRRLPVTLDATDPTYAPSIRDLRSGSDYLRLRRRPLIGRSVL